MPLQYVGGRTATLVGSTSTGGSVSLTALTGGISTSAQAGDIVIAAYSVAVDPAAATGRTHSIKDPSGNDYLLIRAGASSSSGIDAYLRIAYKILTAADASVVLGPTGGATDGGAAAVHVWRGVDTTTPFDVDFANTTGIYGQPNPPAITPATEGAVVVAVAGAATSGSASVFTAPSLQNFITAAGLDTYDAMVGVGSVFWNGLGALDLPSWGGGTTTPASDRWIATTLALRPAPTATTQTLTPSLFTNSSSFYAATVTPGAALLLAPLVDTQAALYAPAVAPQAVTLSPDRFDNASAIYAPAVVAGALALAPPLLSGAAAVYAPTLTPGPITLSPARLDNAQSFFGPAVLAGGATVAPPLLPGSAAVYAPAATAGPVALAPDRLINTQGFFGASVAASGSTLTPGLVGSASTFYGPTVSRGAVALTPGRIDNAQTFPAATVARSQVLSASLVTNTSGFFVATVTRGAVTLQPVSLENGQSFYSPTAAPGAVTIAPAPLVNAQAFFGATIESGQSYVITYAQAKALYQLYLLQGLQANAPLTVSQTARIAGGLDQAISENGGSVTIATTSKPAGVPVDVGLMIDELAALHGITTSLEVTATERRAGSIVQSITSDGATTIVSRQ